LSSWLEICGLAVESAQPLVVVFLLGRQNLTACWNAMRKKEHEEQGLGLMESLYAETETLAESLRGLTEV
jgi:hypothetical protein